MRHGWETVFLAAGPAMWCKMILLNVLTECHFPLGSETEALTRQAYMGTSRPLDSLVQVLEAIIASTLNWALSAIAGVSTMAEFNRAPYAPDPIGSWIKCS